MKKCLTVLCSLLSVLLLSCSDKRAPADLLNNEAELPASLNFEARGMKVLNSYFNDKAGTISMLYGDEMAKRTETRGTAGKINGNRALVTWKLVEDKHWFGARIPGELLSVELVSQDTISTSPAVYTRLTGRSLTKEKESGRDINRTAFILSRTPAVMP